MPNFLPILLIGGAALALSGKKKSKGSGGISLDKPVQVKKDGLVVNSGRSPVPPAVYESPLEPFEDVQQVQEALIAAGKPPNGGADGKWGGQSQGALDAYNHERGFVNEARDHLATPDSLRSLHADAGQGTADGVLANPGSGAGAALYCSLSGGTGSGSEYHNLPSCPPGHHCIPVFNTPIPGYEDVGYCVPTPMLEAGHEPTPEDYAPGGFNEVVFSPDYRSVSIGGGWRFQTLEPWLYNRMKKGELLTFALEGGLFWEDLISSEPKSFWNATLASVGLAVPAGAGIGTKGWLNYRKAFRHEVPMYKIVQKTGTSKIRPWQGPRGFVPPGYDLRPIPKALPPKSVAPNAIGISWPPPAHVVEELAGWQVHALPPEGQMTRHPATGKMVNPDDIRILTEPDGIHKGKMQPYGLRGEFHGGSPQTIIVEKIPGGAAPAGKELYRIGGSSGVSGGTVVASSVNEAAAIAKEMNGGDLAGRAERMVALYGDDLVSVTETWDEAVRTGTKIEWAKPKFRQVAKSIGAPMAVAAVIGASIYGANYLAKKLGERQRDLIAESAVLAWKKFAASNYVRVGSSKKRIDQLPETVAVQFFQAYVAQSILRFQKSTYE